MPPYMQGYNLIIQTLYVFIVLVACFWIYFRTKEIYDLSRHKGIKYFRNVFLFFGLAYLVNFFLRVFLIEFSARPGVLMHEISEIPLISVFFAYATTVAALYLVYSVSWKKLEKSTINKEYMVHLFALLIILITFATGSIWFFLIVHLALFLYATIESYSIKKKRKQGMHSFRVVYLLLFLFAILNVFDTALHFVFPIQIGVYVLSAGIFVAILYKVVQKTNGLK